MGNVNVEAIRATTAIPHVFSPVNFNGRVLVDGAVKNNFPLKLFDNPKYVDPGFNLTLVQNDDPINLRTVGIYLSDATRIASLRDNVLIKEGLLALIQAKILEIFFPAKEHQHQDKIHTQGVDPLRTMYINAEKVPYLNPHITNEQFNLILRESEQEAKNYLANYFNNAIDPGVEQFNHHSYGIF